MTATDLLFVYGTLRRGHVHPMTERLASAAQWIGSATLRGRLYRLAGYPGVIPDREGGPVEGDLFRMSDPATLLPLLDAYEECTDAFAAPHEYRREIVTLSMDGAMLNAWTYVYAWPVAPSALIADGRF